MALRDNKTKPFRTTIRCVVGISLYLLLGAPSCAPYLYEWQGPTPTFKDVLDLNGDGEVARAEWQLNNLETNIYNGEFRLLENSDCDLNGRLTWSEYFKGRVKLQTCAVEGDLYSLVDDTPRLQNSIYPLLLSASELNALNESRSYSYVEALSASIADIPPDIYETPLEASEQSAIDFSCGPVELISIRTSLPSGYPGGYAARTCDVANGMEGYAITLLVVKVAAAYPGRTEITWHAKAVFIPAGASSDLAILLRPDATSLEVNLVAARGMPR